MTRTKATFVSDTQNPANGSPMSLALRQLQATMSGPVFWIIIGAAVLLSALAGPYYTLERLSFPERLVYWGTTVVLSAIVMTFLSIFAHRLTEAHSWNWVFVAVVAGVAGILPVVGTIFLAEGIATGFVQGWFETAGFTRLVVSVTPPLIAVTLVVNALIEFQLREQDSDVSKPSADSTAEIAPLTILQSKLPQHLGRDIVSVQAQDHYVEVTTPLGSAMVLMRLGDAIRDLEPLDGLQVHRSWWINLSHVERTEKGTSGPELVLTSKQRIPVGRSFRPAFKNAMQSQGT
ncbi:MULTISPECIES: LytTR family DNA-binding domain-containing protein [unclassified Phaeobacter]|uniref:LytTR family DNA-binding domain-containing protein n=1 Tax=unclassified Phaeobacter TaxID=2621772 RepID=UPI003A8BACAC